MAKYIQQLKIYKMKKILTLGLAIGAFMISEAQVKWDSTYRPGIYELKKQQFEVFPKSKKDIVFLGNSITDYFEWNEYFGKQHIRNRGISGDITFGVLERLETIIEGKPQKIFILIGTNDVARDIPANIIIGNIEKMIDRITAGSPKTKIYLHTILPVNNSFPNKIHWNKETIYNEVNNGIRALKNKKNITIIDFHDQFLDKEGRLDASLTYDGLHLNVKGYERWAKILKDGNYL